MAGLNADLELKITTDKLDEFAMVRCKNNKCFHNLGEVKGDFCNLKNIFIGEDGRCVYFLARK